MKRAFSNPAALRERHDMVTHVCEESFDPHKFGLDIEEIRRA